MIDPPAPAPRRRAIRQAPTVRRQDLLAVTMSCLARLGPKGTTGREICRQAGVSHGLLRHYFKNPDNLLLETYEELCSQFLARFEQELFAPGLDPRDALERFFGVLFSAQWASADVLGAWIAFWSLVRSNADFARASATYDRNLRALLATALERLPASPGGTAREDVIALLVAVMDGLWLDFCLSPDRLARDRAVALCTLALDTLVPAAPPAG